MMPDSFSELLPAVRHMDWTSKTLGDQVLLCSTSANRVWSLEVVAAQIWSWCDGKTTRGQAVRMLQEEFSYDVRTAETLLSSTLAVLKDQKLLPPEETRWPSLSRRRFASSLGKLGVALPLVSSVLLPGPAAASSGQVLLTLQGSGGGASGIGQSVNVNHKVTNAATGSQTVGSFSLQITDQPATGYAYGPFVYSTPPAGSTVSGSSGSYTVTNLPVNSSITFTVTVTALSSQNSGFSRATAVVSPPQTSIGPGVDTVIFNS